MSEKVNLIQEVKIIMIKENLNQADLVKLWDISRQQVSNILKGDSILSNEKFEQLLNKYNYRLTISKKGKT